MQISNNNVNSMVQLEKDLDKSASNISRLGLDNQKTNQQEELPLEQEQSLSISEDIDLANEMLKQIEIPISYTANAEVISTRDSMYRTVLDIKA